ncbi:MAG: hypothetical protein U5K84_03475 [Alkalibacterium sp.]|nr:hypothetical protein [Alkalibacterium sp.]
MVMPNDFILLAKSLTILEGVVTELHPDINILEIASDYIKASDDIKLLEVVSGEKLKLDAYHLASDSIKLPSAIKRTLDTINNGRLMYCISIWSTLNQNGVK